MSGSTSSMGQGYHDVYVVRVKDNGDLIWQRSFGGSGNDFGRGIVVGSRGLYVAGWAGSSSLPGYKGNYDAYVLKLDLDGNLIWDNCYGDAGYDGSEEIDATSDGGFVVAGHLQDMSTGGTTGYLFKIAESGTLLWEVTPGNSSEATRSAKATADGGVIAAGSGLYTANIFDVYMVKTDASGQTSELEE
jgi:hypothetical protein